MQAPREHGPQPDEELADRAAIGDQTAFATIYERYFDGVYDFAFRTARDREVAADVVQNAFTNAWESMRKGRGGYNLKAWLYAIARDSAIDELRHRSRLVSDDEPTEGAQATQFVQVDPSRSASAQAVLDDQELIELVWSSAAALSPKQYSLLDMHLRRGLTADELAESLHLTKSNVYTMLTRLRHALAESVAGALLLRRGRRECRQLDYLLSEIESTEYTREVRRLIENHLKHCERCRTKKRGFVSPLEVFGGLALVPATPGIEAGIWQGIAAHINGVAAPGGRLMRPAARAPVRASVPLAAAGVAGVIGLVAVLLAGVLIFGASGGGGAATVQDPDDVRATDREPGEPSSDNTIDIEWTGVPGVQAYSIDWTEGRRDLPDTEPDLPGTATGTTSPQLDPGTWYFHLRTQGDDGRWTSTVHAGPFEIIEENGTPIGTTTPTPSPEESETPGPTPQFPTPTEPPQTETPAPTPAPTQTQTPTPPPLIATPTLTALPSPTQPPITP